ncbi:MAG TPA: NINE protein [Allocoleopsis sp.]
MKSKSTAIVLCFFLGGLGVHKLYLGQIAAGIIYLLFSWTFIPSLIAFIEFFQLIFMSDLEFNTKFNPHLLTNNSGTVKSAQDATSALYDLKKLYDAGVITADEYEEKRKKLLNSL